MSWPIQGSGFWRILIVFVTRYGDAWIDPTRLNEDELAALGPLLRCLAAEQEMMAMEAMTPAVPGHSDGVVRRAKIAASEASREVCKTPASDDAAPVQDYAALPALTRTTLVT